MSKVENMLERCARAVYERAETYPPYAMSQMNGKMAEDFAIAVIEALMEPTPEMVVEGAEELAAIDAEGHNDAPFYDDYGPLAQQDFRIKAQRSFVAALRTALSQPNDEGEGK